MRQVLWAQGALGHMGECADGELWAQGISRLRSLSLWGTSQCCPQCSEIF